MAPADFRFIDGERLVRFGPGVLSEAPDLLRQQGFGAYVLLTTARAQPLAGKLEQGAAAVLHVQPGGVPEAAAALREELGGRDPVALGGGRVIDVAKALAGADGLRCAAIPTTLSGAEMTRIHRMPVGVTEFRLVRPALVVADSEQMATAPRPDLTASAMNAIAHASEALYVPFANPVGQMAALRGCELLAAGLTADPLGQADLALGSILAAYALGVSGYALLHVLCQTLVRVVETSHGPTYSVMLPHVLRHLEPVVPDVLGSLATALGADRESAADRASELAAAVGARRLGDLGADRAALDDVVSTALERAELANTPGGAPGAADLRRILEAAW